MPWKFDPFDKDTPTNEAILRVLLDIRDVLADISGSVDGVCDEVS